VSGNNQGHLKEIAKAGENFFFGFFVQAIIQPYGL
jgi:hypothetical protein